jgi:hypothetical protein
MSKDEFYNFVDDNWDTIQAIYDSGETPSIDRIDSSKHYSIDNVRFISVRENASRKRRS